MANSLNYSLMKSLINYDESNYKALNSEFKNLISAE